jgi:hypothetical protein
LLLARHDRNSPLFKAMRSNRKEFMSLLLYAIAVGLAFVSTWVACGLYGLVAAIWFIPDRRIEREIETSKR